MNAAERKKLDEKITVNVNEDMHAEFEAYAQEVEAACGLRVSRGEIGRKLLEMGLQSVRLAKVAAARAHSAV